LWDIDLAFAYVRSTNITPRLGEIRLAWWRERLEELDRGVPPPAEPRLQAVAANLIPAGVTGADLARLEDPWLILLNPFPWGKTEADAIAERGAILFGLSARLLGRQAAEGEPLGAVWALTDAARRVSDPKWGAVVGDRARSTLAALPQQRWPAELSPLVMITGRRTYDFLHSDRGTLHRALWAIRQSWTRTIPKS
jgi:phytoene synthase